jgi:glycosyltransferase involved in cell wall biosynthesis
MRFSLIMATIGRTQEISRFLSKLDSQTYKDFELIVVDQNPDDRLQEILKPYLDRLSILHLTSATGLSRARNVGMQKATGDIVVFPDDDCWYPEDLLERVNFYFEKQPEIEGISGSTVGDSYMDRTSGLITPFNVWKRAISYGIFLRCKAVQAVGDFDETLGVGAGTIWGSGEETDYLIRILNAGYQLYYDPLLEVHHPGPVQATQGNNFSLEKVHFYAMGKGRVLRKSHSPLWFVAFQCTKPLIKSLLEFIQQAPKQERVGWTVFQGILQGWRGSI